MSEEELARVKLAIAAARAQLAQKDPKARRLIQSLPSNEKAFAKLAPAPPTVDLPPVEAYEGEY